MRVKALPFLIVENDTGVILKRATTEILVLGETGLETVLLILTALAEEPRTTVAICHLFPEAQQPEVLSLLEEMVDKRFLVDSDGASAIDAVGETNEDVFYWTANTTKQEVVNELSERQIGIVGINRLSLRIRQSLFEMGVRNIALVDDPALRNLSLFDDNGVLRESGLEKIVDADDFIADPGQVQSLIASSDVSGPHFLRPWNTFCVQRNVHFIPCYLHEMIGIAGPLVIPGETACLECALTRQNAHLPDPSLRRQIDEHLHRGQSVSALHPSFIEVLAGTMVFELCHYYGGLSTPQPGRMVMVNMPAGVTEQKRVLKIPRCPVCSSLLTSSEIQIRKLTPFEE